MKSKQVLVLLGIFLLFVVHPAFTTEPPLLPSTGLGAAVSVPMVGDYSSDTLPITLSLHNMDDTPVEIDAWAGNWSIQVYDADMNVIEPLHVVRDVLRPMPKPTTLAPGKSWDTEITGLKLVAHEPGSTPMWEYPPLKPGVYWIKANYEVFFYSEPEQPQVWMGSVTSLEYVRVEITK